MGQYGFWELNRRPHAKKSMAHTAEAPRMPQSDAEVTSASALLAGSPNSQVGASTSPLSQSSPKTLGQRYLQKQNAEVPLDLETEVRKSLLKRRS